MESIYLIKADYNNQLHHIINTLKFKKHTIKLNGSSSLEYMKYASDYDLYSKIREYKPATMLNEIKMILHKSKQINDLYFIEFKIKYINGEQIKLHDDDINTLNKNMFSNIDYIKIDYVVRLNNNMFKELSIIYDCKNKKLSDDEYKQMLCDDIQELETEGNYYKVLKRYFNLHHKNKSIVNKLGKFFNSEYGQLYENINCLKSIKLLQAYYDDKLLNRKIKLTLKDMNVNNIDQYISSNESIINNVAQKIYRGII